MTPRFVTLAAGAAAIVACATHPPPPVAPRPPPEDKAYAGCPMNRQLDMWLTAPEYGEPPWSSPRSAVEVRDAYCVVEQNRVLDSGAQCLDVRDCDDVPGHESWTVKCTTTPTERFRMVTSSTWDKAADAVTQEDVRWRTRLGQCYRVTWANATPAELAAYERAFAGIDGDIANRGEGALLERWPPASDAAYRRVTFAFAREVTQVRAGVNAKAIVWTSTFSSITRAGKIAELPFLQTNVGVQFGVEGHTTTKANVADDERYCAALHGLQPGDPAPVYSGADAVTARNARRNEAVLSAARGEDSAKLALAAMDDDLVHPGTRKDLQKGWTLRDPCGP